MAKGAVIIEADERAYAVPPEVLEEYALSDEDRARLSGPPPEGEEQPDVEGFALHWSQTRRYRVYVDPMWDGTAPI